MRKSLASPPAIRSVLSIGLAASLALALATVIPAAFAQAGSEPQGPPPAAAPGAPPAGARHEMPRPTNLQVLPKDIPGPELMKVMHSFESQVGVGCGFCHAADETTHHLNFASDAKPEKATARVMMHMTHDINEKYLTQINDPDHADHPAPQVTCGTCHRGKSMPEAFAPVPAMEHVPDDHHGPDDHHAPPA
jgi:hypothetical protein